jgi:hypothetical protein
MLDENKTCKNWLVMATTSMVSVGVCKSSHATMSGNRCKLVKQHWCQKLEAKSTSEGVDVRTCKNSQATPTMLKAKGRIHLSELMQELVKTLK